MDHCCLNHLHALHNRSSSSQRNSSGGAQEFGSLPIEMPIDLPATGIVTFPKNWITLEQMNIADKNSCDIFVALN